MSLYLIVSPKVERAEFSAQTDALDEIQVDYTDMLQLTLQHWSQFGDLPEDLESLRAAMETYLTTHAASRLVNYAHMQDMVQLLVENVTKFHASLQEQLAPVLDQFGFDIQIRLSRHLHNDALIRVEPLA